MTFYFANPTHGSYLLSGDSSHQTGSTSLEYILAQYDCTENDNKTTAALGDAYTVILTLTIRKNIFNLCYNTGFATLNDESNYRNIKLLSEGLSVISDEVVFLFNSLAVNKKLSTSATHGSHMKCHFPTLLSSAFYLLGHNLQTTEQ